MEKPESQTTINPEIQAALVEISDCIASAFQIVQREAIHDTQGTTSWNLAADRFSKILHKHHATILAARDALEGESDVRNQAPDLTTLRLTAYPPGPGPYDRWEVTVEATGVVLISGSMPVDQGAVRTVCAAYHEGLKANV